MANRYGAKKTTVDGIVFDSEAEAKRYGELKLLENAGTIRVLIVHPKWTLVGADRLFLTYETGRKITYSADFQYERGGKTVLEDVKGVMTRESRLKIAIMKGMDRPVTIVKRARTKRRGRPRGKAARRSRA